MIDAVEMEPGKLYLSTGRQGRYQCRLANGHKPDKLAEEVAIVFFEPDYNKGWLECKIPGDYKVQKLLDENNNEIAHDNSSRTPEMKATSKKGNRGAISGLKKLECWGRYFNEFIDKEGGRLSIISHMTNEFPDDLEGILRWVDAYKSYYNLGKLPGTVKQEVKKQWR